MPCFKIPNAFVHRQTLLHSVSPLTGVSVTDVKEGEFVFTTAFTHRPYQQSIEIYLHPTHLNSPKHLLLMPMKTACELLH